MRISNDTKKKLQQVKLDHRLISLDAAILHILDKNDHLTKVNEFLRDRTKTSSPFDV